MNLKLVSATLERHLQSKKENDHLVRWKNRFVSEKMDDLNKGIC